MALKEMPNPGISQVQIVGLLTLFLIVVVVVPNLATGLLGFGFWLLLVSRLANWREAVVVSLVLACVLASSREPGLQYWKTLRLLPAGLAGVEAMRILRSETQAFRRRQLGWLVTIVLCTGIPALLSENARAGLFETTVLGSVWVILMIVGTRPSVDGESNRGVWLMRLGMAVVLASIAVTLIKPDVVWLNGRWRGILGNPNELSHWWLFIFVLVMMTVQMGRRQSVKWLGLTAALFLITGTRGALLAALFAWAGTLVASTSGTLKRVGVFVAAALGVLGMLFIGEDHEDDSLVAFLPEQIIRSETIETAGGRTVAWSHALEEIKSKPWFGQGGGYEERYFSSRYSFFAMQNHQGLSHNSWLAFAMNYGVPAALALIFSLLIRLGMFRQRAVLILLPACVISMTVEGWLTAPLNALSPMMFLVAGWFESQATETTH
ncbi:MAG: O-antigen ligase family protein [Bacteroidota bacterium]|nr:O-antigen ligase family protein [Bacteroidota bacterium]